MSSYLFMVTEIESANGICTSAVMEELVKRGHIVVCLTNAIPGKSKLFTKNGIDYYTVRPRWLYRLQQYLFHRKEDAIKRILQLVFATMNKLKLMLSYFSWPLISPAFSFRYYRKAMKICSSLGINGIIPVYSQVDTLIAGHYVKMRHHNIKYIPYMLDPLAAGNGPKFFSTEWLKRRGLKWEKRLFSNADAVLMMESCRGFYEGNGVTYKGLVYTGLPLLRKGENIEKFERFDENKINLLYIGSIPRNIRSPKHIIDIFSKIDDERLTLYFIGPIDDDYIKSRSLVDHRIKMLLPVSHKESLVALQSADFLVNLGNSLPHMVPSKIFELMSTGLPIISVAQIKDDSCKPYLLRYPNALMLEEGGNDKADTEKLIEFIIERRGKKLPFEEICDLFETNTPKYTADILQSVCDIAEEKQS